MMTVRVGLWRLSVVIPGGFMVGLCTFGAVSEFLAGQLVAAVVALTVPVPIFLLIWVGTRSIRLEITESVVLARQGRFRGHPDLEMPRSEIRAIHYFPRIISFRGQDNKPFMRIDCNYTVRQMTKVAGILEVPLYDHKRWLGLREARIGRLVHDPASGPVARTR
jgi:hypothetical protein